MAGNHINVAITAPGIPNIRVFVTEPNKAKGHDFAITTAKAFEFLTTAFGPAESGRLDDAGPIESDTDEKLADVRMRGNLDLQREDFVLGCARREIDGRWHAQLSDRGDGEGRFVAGATRRLPHDRRGRGELGGFRRGDLP